VIKLYTKFERNPTFRCWWLLPVHKPAINSLYLFVTRTVSQLSSVISKLYDLWRRTV